MRCKPGSNAGAVGQHFEKVAIAEKLRQYTPVSMTVINGLLKMRSAVNVRQQSRMVKTGKSDVKKINKELKERIFTEHFSA